jgi:hypothetical protein
MDWETLTTEDILSEFTIAEAATLRQLQGSGSGSGYPYLNLDVITGHVIDEIRGYIAAGAYEIDVIDGTIPLVLFADGIAIGRWRYLIATPSLRQLQTEDRRLAFEAALAKLNLIAQGKFAIEPPTPPDFPRTGNWNSENKLLMRTHPVPRPGAQFTPQTNTYANPDAPPDTSNDE